jgi:hypothetical protein
MPPRPPTQSTSGAARKRHEGCSPRPRSPCPHHPRVPKHTQFLKTKSRASRGPRLSCVSGPTGRGASRFAGRAPVAGLSFRLERRQAPPRALRTTSFESGLPGPGSPPHRPAVAFGARRASAPARRPAVACGVRSPRSITATSGRLDGLLGGRDALFRVAKPEDCHPRECAHRSEERTRHILKEWHVPPVRDVTCLARPEFAVRRVRLHVRPRDRGD